MDIDQIILSASEIKGRADLIEDEAKSEQFKLSKVLILDWLGEIEGHIELIEKEVNEYE